MAFINATSCGRFKLQLRENFAVILDIDVVQVEGTVVDDSESLRS